MARLIDVDIFLKTTRFQEGRYPCKDIVEDIESQPIVDAVPVVHGRWCWQGKFRACSKCGSYVEFTETLGASFWKFCPFCGAKMDGGENNA